jgi:hypothetical protein
VAPPVADEDTVWYADAVKAVVAHLFPGEAESLEDLLVKAVAGEAPSELLAFIRQVSERMSAVSADTLENLTHWLRLAAHYQLEERWGELYLFLVIAKLPRFQEHLHWLSAAPLSPRCQEMLQRAMERWPLPVPPPPPAPLQDLLDQEEAALPLTRKALWSHNNTMNEVNFANIVPLSADWSAAFDLKDELERLKQTLSRMRPKKDPAGEG